MRTKLLTAPTRFLIYALVVVSAATVLLIVEYSRRQSLYWYDVAQDHSMNLDGQRSWTLPVKVDRHGFDLPAIQFSADTAFLRLSVKSTLGGSWLEPRLKLTFNGVESIQFVERKASGLRYFLLPRRWIHDPGRIALEGVHLGWESQTAELVYFDNPIKKTSKVLVLAPHPDDAEIAAYGFYQDHDSYIVTITAGDYVDGLYARVYTDHQRQRELRGDMRTWDSLTVPLLAGIDQTRVANLGYSNSALIGLYEAKSPPDVRQRALLARFRSGLLLDLAGRRPEPTWQSLVDDLASMVDALSPDIIVAPHPALDAAPDHQLTTVALLQALELISNRHSNLYLYTNHHVLTEYYPFGPASSHVTLPPWSDPQVAFGSIYSHPLTDTDQVNKLFALEAMHDLRAAPLRFEGGVTQRFINRVSHSIAQILDDPLGTYSYFRRAVRPNEVFFVYDPDQRQHLSRQPRHP